MATANRSRIFTTGSIYAIISSHQPVPAMNTLQKVRFIGKPVVFLACLLPTILIFTDQFGLTGSLGANPVEEILNRSGNWALRLIVITLAVTPLRKLSGWNWVTQFRRMIGLYAFFYAFMHFQTWLILDQRLLASAIIADLVKRPYITIGFIAVVLLAALAVTSTNSMRQRLGRRWDKLHASVYAIAILTVWHYWWQVKKDITEPLIYAGIVAALLSIRLWWRYQRTRQRKSAPA